VRQVYPEVVEAYIHHESVLTLINSLGESADNSGR